MKKKRLLIGLWLISGVVALSLYFFTGESEGPIYQDQSLDYWFKQKLAKNSAEADKILRSVGPDAVPYLRKVLRKEDSFLTRISSAARRKVMASKLVPLAVRARLAIPFTAVRMRAEAARILQGLGPAASPAVPELIASLSHKERGIRYSAFDALAAIGPGVEGVIPAVVQSLKHSDPSMRMRAASVVSEYEMYSPGIISALSEAVDDSSPVVRRAALQTLADAGPAAIGALPQLTLMLKEPDEYLRLSAADALWRISPEQAIVVVPLLITLIDVQETRSASGQTSGGDRQALETAAVHVLGEMGPLAKDAAPVVRDLLQRGGDDLRFSAADALRHIDPASAPELVPLFVQLLASTNDLYQPEVIEVLGEIGPAAAKAVPTLIPFLNNEDDTTRLAAASALWRIDPQKADIAVPVLIQLLKREIEGEFNGSDALETLMEMGPAARDAAPAIRALLSHPLEELRHAAAEALTKIESAPGNDRQFRSTGISAGRLHPR